MEYTKDVIFNVKYSKKTNFLHYKFEKLKTLKIFKLFKALGMLIQKDNYFTLTIIISILFLSIDYLIVKKFIEIVNLL